jgi:hypothetical protein
MPGFFCLYFRQIETGPVLKPVKSGKYQLFFNLLTKALSFMWVFFYHFRLIAKPLLLLLSKPKSYS